MTEQFSIVPKPSVAKRGKWTAVIDAIENAKDDEAVSVPAATRNRANTIKSAIYAGVKRRGFSIFSSYKNGANAVVFWRQQREGEQT